MEFVKAFGAALKALQGKHVDAVLAFLLFCAFLIALQQKLDPLWSFAALIVIYAMYSLREEFKGRRDERIAMRKLDQDTKTRRERVAEKLPGKRKAPASREEGK